MTALWLKQHAAGERALARDLAEYFNDQARRVADLLSDFSAPTAADLGQVFNESGEHALLLETFKPHGYQLLQVGALSEIERVDSAKAAALWQKKLIIDGQQEFDFATELPDRLVDQIVAFMEDLTGQPYWQDIQATTSTKITDVLKLGLEEGLNGDQMAKQILKALGGAASKTRARAIARTETTGAMNAGHALGMEDLAADGLVDGKTWLAIIDGDVRKSHADLNDTTVGVSDDFQVGSGSAPYPGHYGLPAAERINCRCTIVSEIA